jgi:maltose-binding protein MalE
MMKAGHVPAITTATVTDPLLQGLQDAFKNGYVRPQVPELGLYWSNFCGSDQIFEKGVDPATWVQEATAAANK